MIAELDLVRLAKVAELIRRGATDGERAAAEAAAVKIARAAGLSLEAALSRLDTEAQRAAAKEQQRRQEKAKPRRAPTWEEFAQQEVARAEAKWKAAVDRYGDPGDLFEETERERLLREALQPLERRRAYDLGEGSFVNGFDDWKSGPPMGRVLEAVASAFPLPTSILDALSEWRSWDDLHRRRERYGSGDVPPHVRVRVAAVESIMDTLPAATWAEMDARLDWGSERFRSGWDWRDYEERLASHERLKADLARLRRMPVQNEHPAAAPPVTASERRRLVIDALRETPDATDREIARRHGVSPTTVGTLRRKLAADDAPLFRRAAA